MYETNRTTRLIGGAAAAIVTFGMLAAVSSYVQNVNQAALLTSRVVQLEPITITGQRSGVKRPASTATADEAAKAQSI